MGEDPGHNAYIFTSFLVKRSANTAKESADIVYKKTKETVESTCAATGPDNICAGPAGCIINALKQICRGIGGIIMKVAYAIWFAAWLAEMIAESIFVNGSLKTFGPDKLGYQVSPPLKSSHACCLCLITLVQIELFGSESNVWCCVSQIH